MEIKNIICSFLHYEKINGNSNSDDYTENLINISLYCPAIWKSISNYVGGARKFTNINTVYVLQSGYRLTFGQFLSIANKANKGGLCPRILFSILLELWFLTA